MLAEVQRGLEGLYRIDTALDVRDFVIDEEVRAAIAPARTPREQLLVAETGGDLELALFVDGRALRNLAANDPRDRLDEKNLADFLLTVEGVSHFVYIAWRAQKRRQVSALELELQAEIDKYVTCLLLLWPKAGGTPPDLRGQLFDAFELAPDLASEERDRYLVANQNARTYARTLDEKYVVRGRAFEMLAELRWFWRQGIREKLAHIAR